MSFSLSPLLQQELDHYNQLLVANPHNPNAYVRRGMAYFKLGQIKAALRDFDQAEALDSRLLPYLWQRGLAYYYAGRYDEGSTQFEVDLTVNSHDTEETLWRFLCMAQSQGVAAARAALQPVSSDPRPIMQTIYDFYAGACTAEALLLEGEQAGDRDCFYRHLYLGLFYEVSGQPDLAQTHLCTAVEQYPINDYMWYLAQVHKQLRHW